MKISQIGIKGGTLTTRVRTIPTRVQLALKILFKGEFTVEPNIVLTNPDIQLSKEDLLNLLKDSQ